MKLYKFTSLEHALNVLIEGLWFSSFFKLNDPMEGLFYHSLELTPECIIDEKLKNGICSLTDYYTNPLLWALYAENGKSVCLEIDKQELDSSGIMGDKVGYTNKIIYFKSINKLGNNKDEIAKRLLMTKIKSWKYEHEYRYIIPIDINENGCNQRITIKSIKSILFGYGLSQLYEKLNTEFSNYKVELYYSREQLEKIKKILDFVKDSENKINVYLTNLGVKPLKNNIELTGHIKRDIKLTKESLKNFSSLLLQLIKSFPCQ